MLKSKEAVLFCPPDSKTVSRIEGSTIHTSERTNSPAKPIVSRFALKPRYRSYIRPDLIIRHMNDEPNWQHVSNNLDPPYNPGNRSWLIHSVRTGMNIGLPAMKKTDPNHPLVSVRVMAPGESLLNGSAIRKGLLENGTVISILQVPVKSIRFSCV